MRRELERILELQRDYSWQNTPAMEERGTLTRDDLPDSVRAAMRGATTPLSVEGSDGTGRKAKVPWVRVYDPQLSETARDGFYVVFLVREDGTGFALSLNQATTVFTRGAFVRLPEPLLKSRVKWARQQIEHLPRTDRLTERIELGVGDLAEGYELGHIQGFEYKDPVPFDDDLRDDLSYLLRSLDAVYTAQRISAPPGTPDPNLEAHRVEADRAAGKRSRSGAPRQQSPAVRDAVERYAMVMAAEFLRSQGWSIKDTSKEESFDYLATKGGVSMHVEVKGTTTGGEAVILTRNEVLLHDRESINACLILVRNIQMIPQQDEPTCTGGVREVWMPWKLNGHDLEPISYEYRTPRPPSQPADRLRSVLAIPRID